MKRHSVFLFTGMIGLTLISSSGYASAQTYPTGPFSDEGEYQSAAYAKTTVVSGTDVIGVVRAVRLEVSDEVDGHCWNNTSAIAARLRAELEKFGIAVYQEPLAFSTLFAPLVEMHTLGYRTGNGICAGFSSLRVTYWGGSKLGSLGETDGIFRFDNPVILWESGALITNSDNLDEQLLGSAQEWVDTLIADISKSRRSLEVQKVLDTWPDPHALTQKEFEEMIAKFPVAN